MGDVTAEEAGEKQSGMGGQRRRVGFNQFVGFMLKLEVLLASNIGLGFCGRHSCSRFRPNWTPHLVGPFPFSPFFFLLASNPHSLTALAFETSSPASAAAEPRRGHGEMVLWELTAITAYFLGLKRTYRLVLRIQRRLIRPNHSRIRGFVYRLPPPPRSILHSRVLRISTVILSPGGIRGDTYLPITFLSAYEALLPC
jgi:hypothetical protein